MKKPKCKISSKGFTLLEVMVALAVFSLSAIALTVQLEASNQLRYNIIEREQALWLAQTELSYLSQSEKARSELPERKDLIFGGRDWMISNEREVHTSHGVSKLVVKVFVSGKEEKPVFTMERYVREK
ncbi:type IV pilus modification PilV family protein [Pseudoteredinibacter isoporae]|uniref:General secretion pathway protein I n=1 Tax=Pseudoteredinibacter isoporae TaxID=570281 RepID=A0A7X0MYC4_9GAMM|nr:prepilin-type N-terminal cleavage/methylation domain-containing protein [Pseudoteredinibacter isoporae]MBB6521867.1 general secretion pathway protein I [Pseudoteredinibacter isoporae]NHO87411.1 prepilin-type N-terminal cleavage/methylation domain-containing protein [Pseudoteredinibacter isoporae]NIB24258.1 prepilin-type N-terminal cleavage/methylation domain-containing protein [Pseudoteredinibacter isoporae]